MEKFLPFEKLSKHKQREQHAARRGGWGAVNPVTRRADNPKAYNRQKARQWKDVNSDAVPYFLIYPRAAV